MLAPESIEHTQQWHVGFLPAPNRGIWSLASGKWGHCYAVRPVYPDRWLLVEQTVWGLDCRTLAHPEAVALMATTIREGHLFLFRSRRRTQWTVPAPLLTCSSVLASLTGLKGWYFTPKQLYRGLQKAHAEVVSAKPEEEPA